MVGVVQSGLLMLMPFQLLMLVLMLSQMLPVVSPQPLPVWDNKYDHINHHDYSVNSGHFDCLSHSCCMLTLAFAAWQTVTLLMWVVTDYLSTSLLVYMFTSLLVYLSTSHWLLVGPANKYYHISHQSYSVNCCNCDSATTHASCKGIHYRCESINITISAITAIHLSIVGIGLFARPYSCR